jgi:hypothetical protein
MASITVDSLVQEVRTNERLVDLINRIGGKLSQVCYHPQLGPIKPAIPAWSKWTEGSSARARPSSLPG